ncbi:YfiR family protein [Telmatobacter bradus]|uniref:YfiR family protein n=1 Tax=Telmatobacter bradus TaxID=474953 RepID=UPI003B428A20
MKVHLRAALWISLWLTTGMGCATVARAQTENADQEQIRAAMLFNLTRFVDWPASRLGDSQKPFLACYLGDSAFGPALNTAFRGKQVVGRPVSILNVSTSAQAEQCHLLYVPSSERKFFRGFAASLSHTSVLTVSERQLGDPGVIIGLPLIDNHIQIQVDLQLAQASSLTISSKLLRLAAVAH